MAFGRARQDAQMEEWERELTRPEGHPVLATLLGAVVLAAGAVLFVNALPVDASALIALAFGAGTPVIVWAIAYAVTIRHASIVWKLLSLMLLGLIALLSVAVALQLRYREESRELAAVVNIEMDENGKLTIPDAKGPLSKVVLAYVREARASEVQLNAKFEALGVGRIGNPAEVTRNPELLKDCRRFERAAPLADAWLAGLTTRRAQFRRDVISVRANPRVKREVLSGFVAAEVGDTKRLATRNEWIKGQLVAGTRLCTILARRRWQLQFGRFAFTSDRDLTEFGDAAKSWDYFLRQQQQAEHMTRLRFRTSTARARAELGLP